MAAECSETCIHSKSVLEGLFFFGVLGTRRQGVCFEGGRRPKVIQPGGSSHCGIFVESDLPRCVVVPGLAILQSQTRFDLLAHGSGVLRDMRPVKISSGRIVFFGVLGTRRQGICFEGGRRPKVIQPGGSSHCGIFVESDLPRCVVVPGLAILQSQTRFDLLAHGSGVLRDMRPVKISSGRIVFFGVLGTRRQGICFEGGRRPKVIQPGGSSYCDNLLNQTCHNSPRCVVVPGLVILQSQTHFDLLAHGSGVLRDMRSVKISFGRNVFVFEIFGTGSLSICFAGCCCARYYRDVGLWVGLRLKLLCDFQSQQRVVRANKCMSRQFSCISK